MWLPLLPVLGGIIIIGDFLATLQQTIGSSRAWEGFELETLVLIRDPLGRVIHTILDDRTHVSNLFTPGEKEIVISEGGCLYKLQVKTR
jgi:hypothetical protein